MPYRKFVLYDGLGAILWTVGFVILGYVLGASWRVAEQWISRTGLLLGALLLIALLVLWVRRTRSRREPA
jgi:undecaprenyl-diphosphatase